MCHPVVAEVATPETASAIGRRESTGERPAEAESGVPSCAPHNAFGYIETVANDFGETFAHRLCWAHAVNSQRRLQTALAGPAHFLEADVSAGPLVVSSRDAEAAAAHALERWLDDNDAASRPATTAARGSPVLTSSGEPVIMAHYPTERSSDLSIERFIEEVLEHNERMVDYARFVAEHASASATLSASQQAMSEVVRESDEPAAFAAVLSRELERTVADGTAMLSFCAGSRKSEVLKANGQAMARHPRPCRTPKGVKLDFKLWDCVEPAIAYLRDTGAAAKLAGHLWLNADVFTGPGALFAPLDAQKFVRLCAQSMPQAVLSLGWGSTVLSTARMYTHDMIDRMIELCMCPIVPWPLPCSEASGDDDRSSDRGGCSFVHAADDRNDEAKEAAGKRDSGRSLAGFRVAPVASCRHMTFAVMAEYALSSVGPLRRLLDAVPGASLTIYSGVGSLGVTPKVVKDILDAYGTRRCFLDLRVTRPWRSMIFGSQDEVDEQRRSKAPNSPRSSCGPPSPMPTNEVGAVVPPPATGAISGDRNTDGGWVAAAVSEGCTSGEVIRIV